MISLKAADNFPEGLTLLGSEPEQSETAAATPFAAVLAHLQVSGLIPDPQLPEPAARSAGTDLALLSPVALNGVLPQPPRLAAHPPAPSRGPEERSRATDLPMTRFAPEPAPQTQADASQPPPPQELLSILSPQGIARPSLPPELPLAATLPLPAPVAVRPTAKPEPVIGTPLDTFGTEGGVVGENENVMPGIVVPVKKLPLPPMNPGGPAEGFPIMLARKPGSPMIPPNPEWQAGETVPVERQAAAMPTTPAPRVTRHESPAGEAARPSPPPGQPAGATTPQLAAAAVGLTADPKPAIMALPSQGEAPVVVQEKLIPTTPAPRVTRHESPAGEAAARPPPPPGQPAEATTPQPAPAAVGLTADPKPAIVALASQGEAPAVVREVALPVTPATTPQPALVVVRPTAETEPALVAPLDTSGHTVSSSPPNSHVNQANVMPGIMMPAKKLIPPPRQHGGPAEGYPITLPRKPDAPPSPPSPEWQAGKPDSPEIEMPAPRPAPLLPTTTQPDTQPRTRELPIAVRLTGAEVLSPAQPLLQAAPRSLQTAAAPVEQGPHPPVTLDFTLPMSDAVPLKRATAPPVADSRLPAALAQPEVTSLPASTLRPVPIEPSPHPSLPQHQWPEARRPSAEVTPGYPVRPVDLPHSPLSLTPPTPRLIPPLPAEGEGLVVSSDQRPLTVFETTVSQPATKQPAPSGGTVSADLIRPSAASHLPANDPAGLVGLATSPAPRFNWRGLPGVRLGQAATGVLHPLSGDDANHQFPLARPGSEPLPEAFPAPPATLRGPETTGLPLVITPEAATSPMLAAVETAVVQPMRSPVGASTRPDNPDAPVVQALELQVEMSEWGQVRISARDTGETVSAQLVVSSQPALQALRSVEGEVRQSFSAQGMQLGSFDVSYQGDSRRESAAPALGYSPLPLAEARDNSAVPPRTRPAAPRSSRQRVDLFA